MKINYIMVLFTLFIFLTISVVSATYTTIGVSNTQLTDNGIYITPTTDSTGTSGGQGVTTNEPFTNIECSNRLEYDWRVNSTITYLFRNCDEYDAVIIPKENENSIMLKLEILKDKSNNTPPTPTGSVYKYFNLYSGSKRFKDAIIKFRVDSVWSSNMEKVTLMKWNIDTWTALETRQISLNNTYVNYESDTDTFSNFVIVGIPKTIEPLPPPTPDLTQTPAPTKQPIPPLHQEPITIKSPGFEMIIALISLILISLGRKS